LFQLFVRGGVTARSPATYVVGVGTKLQVALMTNMPDRRRIWRYGKNIRPT